MPAPHVPEFAGCAARLWFATRSKHSRRPRVRHPSREPDLASRGRHDLPHLRLDCDALHAIRQPHLPFLDRAVELHVPLRELREGLRGFVGQVHDGEVREAREFGGVLLPPEIGAVALGRAITEELIASGALRREDGWLRPA